jgi:hypothetical protein
MREIKIKSLAGFNQVNDTKITLVLQGKNYIRTYNNSGEILAEQSEIKFFVMNYNVFFVWVKNLDAKIVELETDLLEVLNFRLEQKNKIDCKAETMPPNCIGFPMFQLHESVTVFQQLQAQGIGDDDKELLLVQLAHSYNELILKLAKEYTIPFHHFQNNFDKKSMIQPIYSAIINLYNNEEKHAENCFPKYVHWIIRQKLLEIRKTLKSI